MSTLAALLVGMAVGLAIAVPAIVAFSRRAACQVRAAERRARGAERLAEIGTLTGGLAHEIKNPLSTIGLNAQLLVEEMNDLSVEPEIRGRLVRRIEVLRRETDRLRDILTDFLQFAGRVRLDPQPTDLNVLLEELSDFYHPQARQAGVTLRVQPSPTPIMVSVDATLLKQAILNLMINATQAMAESSQRAEGTSKPLRGDASADQRRECELLLRVERRSGGEPRTSIHVTDTGPGIESDSLDEIFHPYYTTKTGGSGLGLSTTRRIVEEHGGAISVHSDVGRGTDFVISLPHATTDSSAQE